MMRFMRHALPILLLLAAAPAAAAGPQAVADQPVVDVGDVRRGEAVRHTFFIRNRGDAPLLLTEVKPTCGCTVAEYDRTIAAGGRGQVAAVVETESFSGPIAKAITVFTNDPGNPRISLVVKANVRQPVTARPGYARFVTVQGKRVEPSTQVVAAADRPELQVIGVRSPYPFVTASHRRLEGEAGRWEVRLELDPGAPAGPLADYVVVRTDHPEQPELRIPVSGLVRPVIAVTPRVADFGRRELAEAQTKSLEVENLGEALVELTEVQSDVEGVEAEIEPVEDGRRYRVRLTLLPGLPKGEFEGVLTLRTSSERQPEVQVPLRGTVL